MRTLEEVADMAELNKELSLREIGVIYEITRQDVAYLLNSRGFGVVQRRPRSTKGVKRGKYNPRKPKDISHITELLDKGLNQTEIARELSFTPQNISYHLISVGIRTKEENKS